MILPEHARLTSCSQQDHRSCGYNEVWSYGDATQEILSKYIKVRAERLAGYINELAVNVTKTGVPTVRPTWWNTPEDDEAYGHNDQYLLGPDILVAPVAIQSATSRSVYFPKGSTWTNFWDSSDKVAGGQHKVVNAALDTIPVYLRDGRKL